MSLEGLVAAGKGATMTGQEPCVVIGRPHVPISLSLFSLIHCLPKTEGVGGLEHFRVQGEYFYLVPFPCMTPHFLAPICLEPLAWNLSGSLSSYLLPGWRQNNHLFEREGRTWEGRTIPTCVQVLPPSVPLPPTFGASGHLSTRGALTCVVSSWHLLWRLG